LVFYDAHSKRFEPPLFSTLASAGGFGRIQRALGPFRRAMGGAVDLDVAYTKMGEKDAARRLNENNKKCWYSKTVQANFVKHNTFPKKPIVLLYPSSY
jgi:hypothetical protein